LFNLKQNSIEQKDQSLTEQVFNFIELFYELFSFTSDLGVWDKSKHGVNWQNIEKKEQDFIKKHNTLKNVRQGQKTKNLRFQKSLLKKMNEFPIPEENSKLKNQIYLFYFFKRNFFKQTQNISIQTSQNLKKFYKIVFLPVVTK
jgi:hypothetical protein